MIRVENLKKTFGRRQNIEVLKGITLDFPSHGLIVLLGQSGSGKTTFLNILSGLEPMSDGKVSYDEEVFNKYDIKKYDHLRREELGFIFQNYHLITKLSVYENVALPLKILGYEDDAEIEHRVIYALRAVNMLHFRARIVTQLSGGQQQRIAIARALVKNPTVIFADEPTGNLDSRNTFEIMNIIKKISETKLVILVSHEKNLVNHYADRIIEIKDGLILSDQLQTGNSRFSLDDHTIFLKDFILDEKLKNNQWDVDLYRFPEDNDVYKVSLILRNKTLYVDTLESIDNVRIINRENNIKVEKELSALEYEKMQAESSFDMSVFLNHAKRQKKHIHLWDIIKTSFLEMFVVTRRTSLLLAVFFLMGMALAIGIPFINNVNSNRMIFASDQQNYIQAQGMLSSGVNYRLIESFRDEADDDYYINVFKQSKLILNIPSIDDLFQPSLNAKLGLVDHIDPSMLVIGRLPEEAHEMVIDFSIILTDYESPNSILRRSGIWEYEQLIGRTIVNPYIESEPFVIVGIVNSGGRRAYLLRESLVYVAGNNGYDILSFEYLSTRDGFELLKGSIPKPYNKQRQTYEVLIPESMVTRYFGLLEHDFMEDAPFQIDFNVYATGIYRYSEPSFEPVLLLPADDVSYRIFQYSVTQVIIDVYTQNPAQTMLKFEETFRNSQTNWPYQNAMNEGRVFLLGIRTLMVIGVLLILLSFLSIYFMLKSGLSKEVQEISVYRALGVRKIDIFKKYFVQTLVHLTMTSVIGYLLFTILVANIDQALVGGSYYFLVTPLSILIGLITIYLIGLMSMIPVIKLLRKSPARLLAYDDIA